MVVGLVPLICRSTCDPGGRRESEPRAVAGTSSLPAAAHSSLAREARSVVRLDLPLRTMFPAVLREAENCVTVTRQLGANFFETLGIGDVPAGFQSAEQQVAGRTYYETHSEKERD